MLKKDKAQNLILYAGLIAIIALGLVVMFKHVKGSVQGKYRQAGDTFGRGDQYQLGTGSK